MDITVAPYAYDPAHPAAFYSALDAELAAHLDGERDWLVNLANASALLALRLPGLNWAGFYLYRGGRLVLGPFQGKPACTRIALGRGVCGHAAGRRETIRVPDVSAFPGHIACDPASASEVVVPMIKDARLLGVLDLDSPRRDHFGAEDATGLEAFVRRLVNGVDWPTETSW